MIRELALRVPAIHPLAARGAQLLRLGEGHPEGQWWFDIEYENDVLVAQQASAGRRIRYAVMLGLVSRSV